MQHVDLEAVLAWINGIRSYELLKCCPEIATIAMIWTRLQWLLQMD